MSMRLNTITLPVILLILVLMTGIGVISYNKSSNQNPTETLSPIVKTKSAIADKLDTLSQVNTKSTNTDLADKDVINILILGIDRRERAEAYRTDIMILLSIDKKNNKVLLTSIPRDLWYKNGRLNALYMSEGFEAMQEAFETITGLTPTRYILTDFVDFKWLVDAVGGLPVDVQTSFTDMQYPVDETLEYQTISFTKGREILTGERALIFARSRKGDFDNGDWGRMQRQHLMLKSLVDATFQPSSFVCTNTKKPFDIKTSCATYVTKDTLEHVLKTVTTAKMDTNLNIFDLEYLWDFYKDKDKYVTNSLIMDYTYLHTPPMEEYGGAWVLAPIGNSFENFHTVVKNALSGVLPVEVPTESIDTTTTNESINPL